jgi:hypothetical protein
MYDRCRHIRVDGARCRAMAVTNKAFLIAIAEIAHPRPRKVSSK